jgi:hypothetical protein
MLKRVAFGLLLACMAVAPALFANEHHDKDKEKEKSSSSKSHSSEHHSSDSEHHSSDHHPGSHESHEGEHHDEHHADAHHNDSHHDSHHDSEHHESEHHAAEHYNSEHHHTNVHVTVIDHGHLHERMSYHSNASDRQHAWERDRAERERFRRHVETIHFVPAHRIVLSHIRIVPATYHYRRTVFYDEYRWAPPAYVYGFYPRYGLWDATFLAFALAHIADDEYALMFYHHRHDAEIEQYLDENRRLAAENDDLRDQLDELDSRMSTLERQGVAVDSSYVPPDAQDVALSPDVIDKLTSN